MLSLLFSAMLVHGHTAKDMLSSFLVSIPKDTKGSMCDSAIHRGIALCSTLCKIFDNVVLNEYRHELSSSSLQFAVKESHSTILCIAVIIKRCHRALCK